MNLPWPYSPQGAPGKDVITSDVKTLLPKGVSERYFVMEYESGNARGWTSNMWERVAKALSEYRGGTDAHIVKRLSGIAMDVSLAVNLAEDMDKISIDKDRWTYICSHPDVIERAALDLKTSLRTWDQSRTLEAFAKDVRQLAVETGCAADNRFEKLWERSARIRRIFGNDPS